MEVDPKSLHPSVLEAVTALKRMPFTKLAANPAAFTARQRYDSLQWRKYGWGLLALALILVECVFAMTVRFGLRDGLQVLACFVSIVMAVTLFVQAYRWAGRATTMEHVRALLPGLNASLDDTQYAYAETVLALDASPHYPESDAREIVAGLNALLDQDRHLADLSEELGSVRAEKIREERDLLRSQAEAAADPDAQRAYAQSLELLEARLAASAVRETARQRIEGQRALVKQAVLSIRDSITASRGAAAMVPATDLTALRGTIESVQAQARSVEAAIDEVRALSAV